MITPAEMIRRLQRIDVREISADSVEETKGVRLEEQKQQMRDGFLGSGAPITPKYAPGTVKTKNKKGQVSGHVTLEDTEEFKNLFFMDVRITSYVIDSAKMVGRGVLLSPFLEKMYGVTIWSIGGDYRARYMAALRNAFFSNIKNKIRDEA